MVRLGILFVLAFFGLSQICLADSCVFTVTRKACPGKEAQSYAKCEGQASCEVEKRAKDKAACESEAKKECFNSAARQEITDSKMVTDVKFRKKAGDEVISTGDICATVDKAKNFGKCKK